MWEPLGQPIMFTEAVEVKGGRPSERKNRQQGIHHEERPRAEKLTPPSIDTLYCTIRIIYFSYYLEPSNLRP